MSRSFLIATSWFDTPNSHQFRALARELAARGHRACIVTDGSVSVEDGTEGVQVIRTWPNARPVHVDDVRFLRRLIDELAVDTLLANFGSVNAVLLGGWTAAVPRRIPWYHTLSEQTELDIAPTPLERLRVHRKRLIYRLATHAVAVSSSAKSDLHTTYRVPDERIVVHRPGLVDVLRDLPPTSHQRRRGVVCPGRLHRSKGQDVLVRALERLPEITATFVGEGPERPHLEQLAESLGVRSRCDFVGSVASARVHEALAGASVAVVPSRAEAFGFTCVEALACGTPVVASATGGLREIVRDGVDGVLVEPGDPGALARGIEECLRSSEIMGSNARERFLGDFELGTTTRRLADWLEAL